MTTEVWVVDLELAHRFSRIDRHEPGFRLGATVATGGEALALLDERSPDVLLIDLDLPDIDGIEVIRRAARQHPACRCLAFMKLDDGMRVKASIEAGASGCLLKDATREQIVNAIEEVLAGGCSICPRIARQVITSLRGAASNAPAAFMPATATTTPTESPLTLRENEILRLTAKGLGFETISDLLEISTHTVVSHVKKIYRKLSVHSRGEAVYEATQMGWL